jgi:hypothetical protein
MAFFATNIVTPAQGITTALATAAADAATLVVNMGPNLPGTTLNGLATYSKNWMMNVGDLRVALAAATANLSTAAQQFATISSLLTNIGSND